MRSASLRPALVAAALLLPLAGCGDGGPEAEILWDEWGVPHIYATDVQAMGHAFGWAQMQLHGDAILELYGMARGRGAEYWGERNLASDRLLHRLGIPEGATAALEEQPPELRRYLEAFARGMNDYAGAHPDAIADSLDRVLPVEAADPLRHGQRQMFAFVAVTGNRPPVMGLDGMPTGAYEQAAERSRQAASAASEGPPHGARAAAGGGGPRTASPFAGSNTWAIGPSRSASGNAMLLQNPHLPWGLPFLRFTEAKLAGPEATIYGTTLVGLPVIAIGFNDVLGWSHTVNVVDAVDAYRLRLAEGGYRFDGRVRPFEAEDRVVQVREDDGSTRADTFSVRRSVHGPVVSTGDSTAVALRAAMFDRWGAVQQWWEMGHARSLAEFEDAMRPLQVPMFTVSYADREGRIFYLFNGQVPDRPSGRFGRWMRDVRGDTSATLWEGIHDYGELPRLVDPARGFLQNSNSPPWWATMPRALEPDSFPPYLSPSGPLNLREERGLTMLTSDDTISFDELVEMRYSSRMLLADRLLDELLPAARAHGDSLVRRAAGVLEAWDRSGDPDSRGAVLFQAWASALCDGGAGGTRANPCGYATRWSPDAPLSTPDGLADPGAAAALLGDAARAVTEAHGSLDVAWGEVMRLGPEIPGNGAPGGLGSFHVVSYRPAGDGGTYRARQGDTWVAALEFTSDGPRGELLLSYGNASQRRSSHRDDQLGLLSREQMRPLWWSRDSVEAHLLRRERPGRP